MKRFAILGHNVSYSRSPDLHEAAFREHEIDASFEIVDVEPNALAEWLKTDALAYSGFAVTKPYKETILPHLQSVSPAVQAVHACNTVTVTDGQLIGNNTDGIGLIRAIEAHTPIKDKTVLILGAGGAAKASVYALHIAGAKTIAIWNRTHETALKLKDMFPYVTIIEDIHAVQPDAVDIIINATTVGLNQDKSILPAAFFTPHQTVFDMVYSPLETTMLRYAHDVDATAITGDTMLVHQAVEQFRLWHDKSIDPIIMQDAFFNPLSS